MSDSDSVSSAASGGAGTVTKTVAVSNKTSKPLTHTERMASIRAVQMPVYYGGGRSGQPVASDYRLCAKWIDTSVCIGRAINEKDADRRWTVAVYRERQCGSDISADGLCAKCLAKSEAYASDRTYRKFHGTILEDPPSWLHMLGTAWAEQAMEGGKLKFKPAEDDEE